MALEQNLILNLPFDEVDGSTVAYDFAANRHDAEIVGCPFVVGKQGNCLRFPGEGYAEVPANVIPLTGNFTILAWVKANKYADGVTGKRIGLFCNTALLEGSREIWIDVNPDSWGFLTIKKAGNTVTLYLDTQRVSSVTLPAALTGIAIIQDVYGTEYGYADLDEVKVYNVALSDDDIAGSLNSVSQLEYYLNGVNFREMGIRVESSNGVTDLPKLKQAASVDWPDYHGKVVDLANKRYEEREITLNCWLKASGKIDFVERVNRLFDILREDGTARLMISIHPTKPLLYEVYAPDGIAFNKRWHDDKMIGTFSLKLKEPDPVKRVVRHQRINDASREVRIALKTDKVVNVYWGDGTVTEDVYGDFTGAKALKHTYAENGVYYVVIPSVIEEITDFSTNGIIVWNRL